jgi:hypothetical protein
LEDLSLPSQSQTSPVEAIAANVPHPLLVAGASLEVDKSDVQEIALPHQPTLGPGKTIDEMHQAMHAAMAKRSQAKVMRKPSAASILQTSEATAKPSVPNTTGSNNPPPQLYGPGKIYTSIKTKSFRVLRKVGDRTDFAMKWGNDIKAAWERAMYIIDSATDM